MEKFTFQSDSEGGVRSCEKHVQVIKPYPNMLVYLCPSSCRKAGREPTGIHENIGVTTVN